MNGLALQEATFYRRLLALLLLEGVCKDVLSLVQSFNFLGACTFTVLVCRIAIHTGRLQILQVLFGSFQLIGHMFALLVHSIDLFNEPLLLICLHFCLLGALGFFNVVSLHVRIIGILVRCLLCSRVSLHLGKILIALLQNSNDTLWLGIWICYSSVTCIPSL